MRYIKNKELLVIIAIYLCATIILQIVDTAFYTNIVNPIFWFFVLFYLICDAKKNHIRSNRNNRYLTYMIIISCMYVIAYFYIGFIFGFSKSPYNHDILAILKNVTIQMLPVIGIEVARWVIVVRNKNNKILLSVITILLILIEIKYNTLINLSSNKENIFKHICGVILPQVAYGVLFTYLALKTSYSLNLVFRIFSELEVLLLPILPDINWFINGSIGVILPVLIYVLFRYNFIQEKKDIEIKPKKIFAKMSYVITLILSITLVCFMLGIFKYEPIAILSNSMIPTFSRGDAIIFKKMSDSQLKEIPENSIIIYKVGEQNIAHRVVNVIEKNGTILYQTKGDNNNSADINLVEINQIKGVYAFHIKYIGFPSVWLYDYFHSE